ncbi:uncharacterized protein LOC129307147 [Prosopis cineraria]|uniref:uncharacterized protein LOC129307147 n=1 Tax=Prosopis cineraria TaxID=364024 RepID=UPI0024103731|nr:uncharacterized protein LOC129307147 [Prosopis cineraria]
MEGNMSQGGIVPAGASSFGGFDIPTFSHQSQHPQSSHHHQTHPHQGHSPIHEGFPLSMGTLHSCDQTISLTDFNRGDRSKGSASEEDERSFIEDGRGKKGSPWHRVKWTDNMVKLLITAVSYLSEDVSSDFGGGGRRKFAVLQKKGKWKCISKVMAERGFHVSPQQCEDKFNDLNKRYKKLNDMLGRGTSCQVVENPALLDEIDFLSEKEKDDVRKILSSKQLFYEEMCSYHNCNRLALPHDPALRCSLQLALKNRDDHDNDDVRSSYHDDNDEDDLDLENDDDDDFHEDYACHGGNRGTHGTLGGSMKKLKQSQEDLMFVNPSNSRAYNKSSYPHGMMVQSDVNQGLPESKKATWLQEQWIESRSIQLEEQKMQLQVELLELEKQRLKWQRFCKKKDRDLEKMRMENERMKLENERMALELKRKKMESGFN